MVHGRLSRTRRVLVGDVIGLADHQHKSAGAWAMMAVALPLRLQPFADGVACWNTLKRRTLGVYSDSMRRHDAADGYVVVSLTPDGHVALSRATTAIGRARPRGYMPFLGTCHRCYGDLDQASQWLLVELAITVPQSAPQLVKLVRCDPVAA